MQERAAGDSGESVRDHGLNPTAVYVADRVDGDPELSHERLLAGIEGADSDERHSFRIDGG